jgi:predicted hydrocarbon binding protein
MAEGRKIDNTSMRIWLETIEDIVGPDGFKSILNHAHLETYSNRFPPANDDLEIPLEDIHNVVRSFIELYGGKDAYTLQVRAGHEFVQRGLRTRPGLARVLELAVHLVPESRKIQVVLEKYAEETEKRISSPYEPRVEVKEEDDCFLFIDNGSIESEDVIAHQPVCGVNTGVLQALITHVTGHHHAVEEIECRAMGHPSCVFRIEKSRKKE